MSDERACSDPVGKALWYVESHFAGEISLEEIAAVAGVSRFHLTRAFGEATGHSLMRYVRARRLTEAARSLAKRAPDILALALEAGYNSHEAFTRAFRDQFGCTPESIRAQGHVHNLQLMEPIKMQEILTNVEAPRIENGKLLLIAGMGERYTCETSAGIPALWQRFVPHLDNFPGHLSHVTYGVSCNSDGQGNFDYICGVEVGDFSKLSPEWSRIRIAPRRYAVFTHRGHISGIRGTWAAIWNKALPESGYKLADAPDFERYDEHFDPRTGMGGVEIWIPIQNGA